VVKKNAIFPVQRLVAKAKSVQLVLCIGCHNPAFWGLIFQIETSAEMGLEHHLA
jgi:hypothetical protein